VSMYSISSQYLRVDTLGEVTITVCDVDYYCSHIASTDFIQFICILEG